MEHVTTPPLSPVDGCLYLELNSAKHPTAPRIIKVHPLDIGAVSEYRHNGKTCIAFTHNGRHERMYLRWGYDMEQFCKWVYPLRQMLHYAEYGHPYSPAKVREIVNSLNTPVQ